MERNKIIEEMETEKEIVKSKYAKELKEVLGKEGGTYLGTDVRNSRNGLEIIGRFRMGNETRASEYWRKEEDKICRMCKKETETIKHVLEECEWTGNKDMDWKKQLKGDKALAG